LLYAALAYGLSNLVGVSGLGFALSATSTVFALLGLAATRGEIGRLGGRHLLRSFSKVLVAGAVMYAFALIGATFLGTGSGFLERVLVLAVVGSISLSAYLGAAYLLGAEELKSVLALLRRKFNN
jgi:hypothetical protein